MAFALAEAGPRRLTKEAVAATLRGEIVSGVIEPGEAIVEGRWANRLGVAQASVREALNILAGEGFVQKSHGRRARVTKFNKEDVRQNYQMRGSLEGLAARLIVEQQKSVALMDEAWSDMQLAATRGDIQELVHADLRFHLHLCELSGNRFLVEHARRLLVPLFAFVLMRVHTNNRQSEPWKNSLELHGRILDVLRFGDPFVAEQFVIRATSSFANFAYDSWENKPEASSS